MTPAERTLLALGLTFPIPDARCRCIVAGVCAAVAVMPLIVVGARAETLGSCRPGEVMRVVEGLIPGALGTTDLVNRPMTFRLVCRTEGPCHYETDAVPPVVNVICVPKPEEAAAIERGRR